MFTLDMLPLNSCATIFEINCNSNVKHRLLDLGLIKGTKIKAVLKSPLGDPIAYEIRGSTIALRCEDASLIKLL